MTRNDRETDANVMRNPCHPVRRRRGNRSTIQSLSACTLINIHYFSCDRNRNIKHWTRPFSASSTLRIGYWNNHPGHADEVLSRSGERQQASWPLTLPRKDDSKWKKGKRREMKIGESAGRSVVGCAVCTHRHWVTGSRRASDCSAQWQSICSPIRVQRSASKASEASSWTSLKWSDERQRSFNDCHVHQPSLTPTDGCCRR